MALGTIVSGKASSYQKHENNNVKTKMDDRDQQQTAGTDSCDDRRARFNYHPNDCYDFKLQRGMNNPIPLDGSGLDCTYSAHEFKRDG